MEIKRILVTGSEGYIGRAVVPLLVQEGYEVNGIDTLFFQESSTTAPFERLTIKDIRTVTEDDLADTDAVIHLAALSNDPMGQLDEDLTMDINYRATVRLATLAKRVGVRRFIFSSSCSVYGKSDKNMVDESSHVHPLTAYARSKVLAENALKDLADSFFCVILLRNATVYGYSTNFRSDLVVNNLVLQGVMTNKIELRSDGMPWRPLIDVRDVARCISASLVADSASVNGKILNCGFNENNYRVRDIVETVKVCLPGCAVSFAHKSPDERSYRVSFDRLHKLLPGVKQEWSMISSVNDLLSHYHAGRIAVDRTSYERLKVLSALLKEGSVDGKLHWKKQPVHPHYHAAVV